MNSNKNNDIIEISDDSNDIYGSNSGASSLQGTKRQHTTVISDFSDDSSSSSDSDEDVELIENDSESEPDLECDIWDDDCVVLDIKPKTAHISGFHLMPTCSPDPESKSKKTKLSVELNNSFSGDDFKKLLKENFDNDNVYNDKTCEIICDPWKVLVLNNLLQDVSILEEARKEMYEITWNQRTMDLYEFFQSEDLKNISSNSINMIYEFLRGDLKSWVEHLTGLEFTDVSATCSFYSDTDFLILHDDQRENRAVAFVLYLNGIEEWNSDWGGALQLFDRDGNGQPNKCTRNIIPKNNQLVLFPVSDYSYHQVEEVTCKNFTRMSINGWFHVKEPLKFESPLYEPPGHGLFSDTFDTFSKDNIDLSDWVDHSYLLGDGLNQSIHHYFEESSEYSLESFFIGDKMDKVCEALADKDIKWEKMGPPNRRNYEYISHTNLPRIIEEFVSFFKAEKFIHLLKEYTELDLTKMKWELQKWTPGCYTLLQEHNKNQLNVIVFLGETEVVGGKTNFVTLEDEVQTALLTIPPSNDNSLSLVYGDTARYTSFVSRNSKSNHYYMLVAAYFEDEE